MNKAGPDVKKRVYTRLMDVYRHNDIYFPGFNLLTRSILRFKAETAYRHGTVFDAHKRTPLTAWFIAHQYFFGFGVFRSGTTFLADFLNRHAENAIVTHEANVNDYWFYAKAIHSAVKAEEYVRNYRLGEIYSRMKGSNFHTYGEINPFLRRHAPALSKILPHAKQFQIVRDPRNVIRSLMSRELLGKKDPMEKMIFPPVDDPFAEEWERATRFERLCWLWKTDNRFLRKHTGHTVKFEQLRKDFDYFDQHLLQYLQLKVDSDSWQSEMGKVFNSTPRYTFPEYREWPAADKRSFERICEAEMAEYGY